MPWIPQGLTLYKPQPRGHKPLQTFEGLHRCRFAPQKRYFGYFRMSKPGIARLESCRPPSPSHLELCSYTPCFPFPWQKSKRGALKLLSGPSEMPCSASEQETRAWWSPHGEGSSCSRELWFPMPGTGAGWGGGGGADCNPQAEVGRLRTDVTSQWLRPLTLLLLHVSFLKGKFSYTM